MVSTRARPPKATAPPPVPNSVVPTGATPPPSSLAARGGDAAGTDEGGTHEYERCRDERIRENKERMRKLGILDLAHNLKSSMWGRSPASSRPYKRRASPSSSPSAPGLPPRRSSRLQNVTPVSYVELPVKRRDEGPPPENIGVTLEDGPKEEVYTDEHEKLLGTCETSWTLFVDGYDKDGVRVYDPVEGKTCHQCRQKTLGHRTHCSKCNIVQGQFCGDCLYTRYGENVLEANMNPDWTCPVCRGICNCSICRAKKGWPPTGKLYKKVSRWGFKSVAHYLIQTRRGGVNMEGATFSKPVSAKRSLPFTDEEGPSENSDSNSNSDHSNRQDMLLGSDSYEDKDAECSRDQDMQNLDNSISVLGSNEILRMKVKETECGLIMEPSMDSIVGRLRNHGKLINCGTSKNSGCHYNGQTTMLASDNSFQPCTKEKTAVCGGGEEAQNVDECDRSPALGNTGQLSQKVKEMESTLISEPSADSIARRTCCTSSQCSQQNGENEADSI